MGLQVSPAMMDVGLGISTEPLLKYSDERKKRLFVENF
jgi:hypothetical protein